MNTRVSFAPQNRNSFDVFNSNRLYRSPQFNNGNSIFVFSAIKEEMMLATTNEIYFTAQQAAKYIQRPYKTLEGWRTRQNSKLKHISNDGDIRYRKSDELSLALYNLQFPSDE